MSDAWEVVATAQCSSDEVMTVSLLRRWGEGMGEDMEETFRMTWADGTEVDLPVEAIGAMMVVARCSISLPADLFGDTTTLVQSIDRLVQAMSTSRERARAG